MAALLMGVFATGAEAAPSTQPAKPGLPNRIAVVGDSISAGTGTGGLPASEQKQNSWATGTNNNSLYQRILAINPAINGNNQNVSANGEEMKNAAPQVNRLSPVTDLVTIQMGGNDLCKDTVGQMTTVASYRTQFVQFLQEVKRQVPDGLILVASIPDIFNLWYVRGAPGTVNGQQSSRAGTARLFWDTLAVIPCRSLVTNPTSTSASDTLRRNQVRQRNIELNYVLQEECAKVIRCRFDDWKTFDLSSNRDVSTESKRQLYNRSTNIADWGNYEGFLPPSQWGFEDDDVSTIDHFHPSNAGHRKLAQGGWEVGYDYSDKTYPQVSSRNLNPAPMANGINRIKPTVTVTWSDAAGVRGIEYRVRTDSDGGGGTWTEAIGSSVSVPMTGNGTSYLETRAFDVNGNRSTSNMTKVEFDPTRIPAPALTGVPETQTNVTEATVEAALEPGLILECSQNGGAFQACQTPLEYPDMTDGNYSLQVRQTDGQGNTSPVSSASWTVNTRAPSAPVLTGVPPRYTNLSSATIAISGAPDSSFECRYGDEGQPYQPCTSPWVLSNLGAGEHRISVRQIDPASNVSASADRIWEIGIDRPGLATITSAPPLFTNRDNPTFEFIGDAGATFECRFDRPGVTGSFQPCVSPFTVSNATVNSFSYTFRVRQTDRYGNKSLFDTSRTWTLDKTPPIAPLASGAPQGLIKADNARISFSQVGTDTASFECSTNDSVWIACQSPLDLAELPDGPNSFAVRQVDVAGNRGPGTSFSWQIKSFTAPPFVTVGPPALTRERANSISFTGELTGSFACSLNGATFNPCTSPVAFSGQADGDYTLRLRQTDSLGTVSELSTVLWRVDGTPPGQPNLTSSLPTASPNSSQSIPFAGEAGGSYECRLNNGAWAACTSPFATGALPDGQQRFEVRQTDDAGNVGTARAAEWVIKTSVPAPPTVGGNPIGTVRSKIATMTFSGEDGATIECRLNGGSWSPCPSPMSVSGLPEGANRMEARQVDIAGNESGVAAVVWTVDTVAPKLKGQVKASRSRTSTVIRSSFDRASGVPARIEYSTSKKKPSSSAAPARSRTVPWKSSVTIRGSARLAWVRVFDQVGNGSAWYPIR